MFVCLYGSTSARTPRADNTGGACAGQQWPLRRRGRCHVVFGRMYSRDFVARETLLVLVLISLYEDIIGIFEQ